MKIFLGYGYSSWTTAAYLENALLRYAEVVYVGTDKVEDKPQPKTYDILSLLSGAREGDVFLYIDGPGFYFPKNIEKSPVLTACYLIDVHVGLSLRIEMAKFFDIVFIAQKDYLEDFRRKGIRNVFWIPFACEPQIYKPEEAEQIYDIGFVGHVKPDMAKRKKLLSLLSSRYRMNDYCKFYYPQEATSIYNSSKIVFNCSANKDLNMRVFEALSCGRLLMTDAIGNGLNDIFKDREHLILYRDEKELLNLAEYYLSNKEERERIARCGKEAVHSLHTYDHRIRKVLEIIKAKLHEGKFRQAYFRHAPDAEISLSWCKIYTSWQQMDRLLAQRLNKASFFISLLKGCYVLKTFLALLKNKIKNKTNFRK